MGLLQSAKFKLIISIVLTSGILMLLVYFATAWFGLKDNSNADDLINTIEVPKYIYVTEEDLSDLNSNYISVDSIFDDPYNFGTACNLPTSESLSPSSYSNGTFWFANKISENGTAQTDTQDENVPTFIDASTSSGTFYLERTYYILTVSEIEDVTIYLSNITISQGSNSSSDLYKAVRVSISGTDKNGSVSEVIYRYDSTDGIALPASGARSILQSDIAVDSGEFSQSESDYTMSLSKVSEGNAVFYSFTVKIWIEGQNSHADSAYAGTGFFVSMSFRPVMGN